MPPPSKPSRRFSFFGLVTGGDNTAKDDLELPQLNLEADREVYRPGDPLTITIEIKNPTPEWSLLIEKLNFEIKGIEKLDPQWFNTPKPTPHLKQRRGEYVFMDCSTLTVVSNQILSCGTTKTYMVRTLLPTIIPPSYRGAAIRYLYYVRCALSGQYLNLENGSSHEGSIRDLSELESRIPFQVWVSQENNGLQSEEACNDGIVPASTILLDVYWKEMNADSEWVELYSMQLLLSF